MKLLKASANPEQRSMAEVLEAIASLRQEVYSIRSDNEGRAISCVWGGPQFSLSTPPAPLPLLLSPNDTRTYEVEKSEKKRYALSYLL